MVLQRRSGGDSSEFGLETGLQHLRNHLERPAQGLPPGVQGFDERAGLPFLLKNAQGGGC